MEVVEEQRANIAIRVCDLDIYVAVLSQHGHEVRQRHFEPVDFAALQRRSGSRLIGDHNPFDPLGNNALAACEPRGRLLARCVVTEFLEHRFRARYPFVARKAHRSAADIVADPPERIGRGDACRHDEAARGTDLAERQQHLRVGLLQGPAKGAAVHRDELVLDGLDHLPDQVAHRPAIDARDRILGEHRFAIVELEPSPQPEGPSQAVRGHLFRFDHLALRLEVGVHAVEHVPHQEPGIARDIGRGPDRIEIGEVCVRDQPQRPRRSALRYCGRCKSARPRERARGGRGFQECASIHVYAPALSKRLCCRAAPLRSVP